MSGIVADASFLIALLTDTGEAGEAAFALRDAELHAPTLVDFEVTQILRGHELHGRLAPAVAEGAFSAFTRTRITRWPFEPFAARIWELRRNVSAYDASYVALAEYLDVPLVTFDRRLARASGPRCEIRVPAA